MSRRRRTKPQKSDKETTIFKMSDDIANLDHGDIGDNLLYYDYSIKHLMNLHRKGMTEEDPAFLSAYRSFEGEVFENFIYEKLLRYAREHDAVEKFIVKGPHKKRTKALSSTLSVNWKGQIVYRTRQKEIGEFDSLIFTKTELYFVEMTLVKSVTNLKKRLRKKKALLETIFPDYEVKALLVLNEGATGTSQLPDYCTVWITRDFCAKKVFEWLVKKDQDRRRPFYRINHHKMVGTAGLNVRYFKYYSTLGWILRKVRAKREGVIDLDFLKSPTVSRYHNLYTKIYIGYMEPDEFRRMFPKVPASQADKVFVALEKEHSDELTLTYFMRHSRKHLDNITTNKKGEVSIAKKDPFGITVTEVAHISKMLNPSFRLTADEIETIEKRLDGFRV